MFIDKSTIFFSNGKQFCGKTFVLPVLPRNLGKIKKSFSPKLPDYFMQELMSSIFHSKQLMIEYLQKVGQPHLSRSAYLPRIPSSRNNFSLAWICIHLVFTACSNLAHSVGDIRVV